MPPSKNGGGMTGFIMTQSGKRESRKPSTSANFMGNICFIFLMRLPWVLGFVINTGFMLYKRMEAGKFNVVLGAGAAGLAAAWQLSESGKPFYVLERNPMPGGLLSYHEKNGNVYEYGTHVFHTDNESFRQRIKALMGDTLFDFDRAGKLHINFQGKYYRYPLNGIDIIRNLPLKTAVQCVFSLATSYLKFRKQPQNSAEVLQKHFGTKLYDIFFKDYTHKFWGRPCEELDKTFALERIPRSDVLKILHDIFEKLGIDRMFSGHNLTERVIGKLYYAPNGIHQLIDTLVAHVTQRGAIIETGIHIEKIITDNGKCSLIQYRLPDNSIKQIHVDNIISTIPIKYLVNLFSPSPNRDVTAAANRLSYLPLTVCGLLVKKQQVRNAICTYYRDAIFNRLSEPTVHGLVTVPPGKTILLAEMTDYSIKMANVASDGEIISRVIADIVNKDLICEDDVEDTCLFRYEEAYPIYHIGFKDDLNIIGNYLNSMNNVLTTGRQGLFCYVNIHATMQMAMRDAGSIQSTR